MQYRIDQRFIFDSKTQSIEFESKHIQLPKKYVDVLILLLENAGEMVTREMLFEQVWEGTIVVDEALTQAISELRKIFSDSPKQAQFIKTVPKKGYIFVAEVERIEFNEKKLPTVKLDRLPRYRKVFIASLPIALLAFILLPLRSVDIQITHGPIPATSLLADEHMPLLFPDPNLLVFVSKGNVGLTDGIYLKSFVDEQLELLRAGVPKQLKRSADATLVYAIYQNNIYQIDLFSKKSSLYFQSENHILDVEFSMLKTLYFFTQKNDTTYGLFRSDDAGFIQDIVSYTQPRLRRASSVYLITETKTQSVLFELSKMDLEKVSTIPLIGSSDAIFLDDDVMLFAKKSHLYSFNRVSKQLHDVFFTQHQIGSLNYSAHTKRLVFETLSSTQNIWKKQAGENDTRLDALNSTMADYMPRLSPVDSSIAFVSTRCGNQNLWYAENEHSRPQPLTKFVDGQIHFYAWQKSGKAIFFVREFEAKKHLYSIKLVHKEFEDYGELSGTENLESDYQLVKDQAQRYVEKTEYQPSDIYFLELKVN
jgi:DNA-binding winged helix-turn-helix (wHTH) protein